MSYSRIARTICQVLAAAAGSTFSFFLILNKGENTPSQNRLLGSLIFISMLSYVKVTYHKHRINMMCFMLIEGLVLMTIDQLNKADRYNGITPADNQLYSVLLLLCGVVQWTDVCWVLVFIWILAVYIGLSIIKGLFQIREAGNLDGNGVFVDLQESGLTEHEKNQLQQRVITYTSGEDLDNHITCSICLAIVGNGEEILILPRCSHSFHMHCLTQWFEFHITCPYCRTNIRQALSAS